MGAKNGRRGRRPRDGDLDAVRSAFTHPTYLSVHLRPICIKRVYVSTFYAILQGRPKETQDLLPYLSLFIERAEKANRVRGANNRVPRFLFRISFGFGESREQSIFIYSPFFFLSSRDRFRSLRKFLTTIREKFFY